MTSAAIVVVTGANGLVGEAVCAALSSRGASVRALVRAPGTAPVLPGVVEVVGDFASPGEVLQGATAAVTTVHPMASDQETQHRIGVEGTSAFARAAVAAGVGLLLHVSTAGVYDRSPGVGDVDESSALVPDGAGAYGETKRDTELALAGIDGLTRVLLRPPAILGAGSTSMWNTLRPSAMRDFEGARGGVPAATFSWVHVSDLAALISSLAVGELVGPEAGGCTAVNVAAAPALMRDYVGAVCSALGVDPVWDDAPAWTGHLLTGRVRSWGWVPRVELAEALAEIRAGLT